MCCAGRKFVVCEKEKKGKQGLGCILFATKFIFMRSYAIILYATIANYVVVCYQYNCTSSSSAFLSFAKAWLRIATDDFRFVSNITSIDACVTVCNSGAKVKWYAILYAIFGAKVKEKSCDEISILRYMFERG